MRRIMICFLLIALLLPIAVVAQGSGDASADRPAVGNLSVLAYRLEFEEIVSILGELSALLAKNEQTTAATQLAITAGRMTDEDLAQWMAGGVDLSELLSRLRELQVIVDQNERHRTRSVTGPSGKTPGYPDAAYSVVCGSERGDTDAEFAAKVALQVAKGVWSIASRGCDETIVVLGEGGNLSLACIAADAILFIAEAVLEDFFFCDDAVNAAEIEGSYERLGHLHGDMDALQADVTLDMMLMIEQNLMIISPNQIIVTYAIPASNGGLLDLVVTVIEKTIQDAMDAGLAVNFAQSFFDQAEVLRADESYKRAFLMYRRAYQEVARLP